jgi:hypothetical protein
VHRRRHGRCRPVRGRALTATSRASHIFRATLRPKVYRDIEIGGASSLADLARAIVDSFGFEFDHAYGFYSRLTGRYHQSPERYELFADIGDAEPEVKGVQRTPIPRAFPSVGKKMLFIFDYGDHWQFKVELRAYGESTPEKGMARVVKSVGKAPGQYPDPDDE